MLEKLKTLSQVVLIPAVVLYLLGFICIATFLARFGIVTFDVVNARFLIAGGFPLLSLIVASTISWFLFSNALPMEKFWGARNWRPRYRFYFIFASLTFGGSFSLSTLFTAVSSYTDVSAPEVSPPAYEAFGNTISALLHLLPEGIARLVVYTAWAIVVILVIGAVLLAGGLLRLILSKYGRSAFPSAAASTEPASTISHQAVAHSSVWIEVLFALGDLLAVSAAAALFFDCAIELRVRIFSFASFDHPQRLDTETIFFWLYGTVSSLLLFLVWMNTRVPQLTLDNILRLHPVNLPDVIFYLIFPVFVSMFVFAVVIFPRIPFAVGGGEPRKVMVRAQGLPTYLAEKPLFLIGESDQFLFLVDADASSPNSFQVNKRFVEYLWIGISPPSHQ